MFTMFRKVNSSERVVGWYSTGTVQRKADIHIHEVIRQYTTEPVFTLIDVQNSSASEAPAKAFVSLPAAPDALATSARVFRPVPAAVGAEEAEEVGVEHLLRDLRGLRHVSLTEAVQQQVAAVAALEGRMQLIADYLDDCAQGRTQPNPKIIQNAQSILAMVPNLAAPELADALATHQNDSAALVFVASLVRAVTRLHDLISNKKMNREAELNENTKRALLAATQLAEDDAEAEGIDMDAVGEPSAE
jgi:26S proteasome regulatory subunit N8